MQIIANLASDAILGTDAEPPVGDATTVNGKYMVFTPPGVAVDIDAASYMLPLGVGSVPDQIADELLTRNPAFDHRLFNFFLASTDIAALDLSGTATTPTSGNVVAGILPALAASTLGPRCQVGRGVGPAPVGVAPNSVAVLPRNDRRSSPTYGNLVMDTVDLTPFNPGTPGTDEVMIWWKVATMDTSEDVVQGYNTTAGQNTPAIRQYTEVDPSLLLCYASVDAGVTWIQVPHLTPTDLLVAGTDLRIAFLNEGTVKLYLLGYIILFPDLP